MSSNDNGLYEFLKGKSLFSPTKPNRKRSRSRSRGPREFQHSSNSPTLPLERNDPKINPIFNARPPAEQYAPLQQRNYSPLETAIQSLPPPPPPQQHLSYTPAQRLNQESETGSVRWGGEATGSQVSQNSVWTGILSYSNSFQSSRVESSQCLENLSIKIRRELSSIHTKIDVFNSRMAAVLSNEFRGLREKVQQVLETAFKESDKYVQEYMKQKEAVLAGELHQMKISLEKELNKVEVMKDELNKPTWRKTAGEILSTDLQHKVEQLLQRSSQLEVGKWELGDLAGYRIKNIEGELREMVRLKA